MTLSVNIDSDNHSNLYLGIQSMFPLQTMFAHLKQYTQYHAFFQHKVNYILSLI